MLWVGSQKAQVNEGSERENLREKGQMGRERSLRLHFERERESRRECI